MSVTDPRSRCWKVSKESGRPCLPPILVTHLRVGRGASAGSDADAKPSALVACRGMTCGTKPRILVGNPGKSGGDRVTKSAGRERMRRCRSSS